MINERNCEKIYKPVISISLICFLIALGGFGIQSHRLEQTRSELNSIRIELRNAQDRQYEIADIVRRDSEILNESFNTIAGIREQIKVIRESHEAMEKLLYSDFLSSRGRGNSNLAE